MGKMKELVYMVLVCSLVFACNAEDAKAGHYLRGTDVEAKFKWCSPPGSFPPPYVNPPYSPSPVYSSPPYSPSPVYSSPPYSPSPDYKSPPYSPSPSPPY